MSARTLAMIALIVFTIAHVAIATESAPQSEARLSELKLDPLTFGDEWRVSPGVVLDTWDGLPELPEDIRESIVAMRGQLEPLGVTALGEYTCVRAVAPLNTVSVRVFRFESAELCEAWRQKKYRYAGWEEHYRPVEGLDYLVDDSTQIAKRIVVHDRLWITAHHVGDGDLHLLALDAILRQLEFTPGAERTH